MKKIEIVRFLEYWQKKFEEINSVVIGDRCMERIFRNCPSHCRIDDVLIKVISIDKFYRAIVYDHFKMAQHIGSLKNLKSMILNGEEEAVEVIRLGHGIVKRKTGKEIDLYSFASKYCHWSNPKRYPMYDQYVEKALEEIRKKNLWDFPENENFKDYANFKKHIDVLKNLLGWDYKKLDEALWIYGRYLKNNLPNDIQKKIQSELNELKVRL